MDVIIHVINNPCKSFHQNFHPCNRNHKAAFPDQPLISIAASLLLISKNISMYQMEPAGLYLINLIWMVSIQECVRPGTYEGLKTRTYLGGS